MGCALEWSVRDSFRVPQVNTPARSSELPPEGYGRAATERIPATADQRDSSGFAPIGRIQLGFDRKNLGELRPEESEQRIPGIGGGDCIVDIEASVVHVAISHARFYLDAGAHARALEARFEHADG